MKDFSAINVQKSMKQFVGRGVFQEETISYFNGVLAQPSQRDSLLKTTI